MAATVSGAWGKPGAWALDSEENEAEILQQNKEESSLVDGLPNGVETAEFPSLSAAAAAAKTKKKKPQTLSLKEFSSYGVAKPAPSQPKGLTLGELSLLPTGPRQRTAEELDRNKLGGGFTSYGGGARDDQPRRQGGFNRDSNREFAPSRADEADNWGAGKKLPAANNVLDRKGRGGIFTNSQSRADEIEKWASNKSFVPSEPREYGKRGGFGSDSSHWGKIGGAFDSLEERRGGFESNKRDEGRPRLNLQPRTLPVIEGEKSEIVKPKGSNPFGEARPREEVLKEKGRDSKEIEDKLESVVSERGLGGGRN